MVKGNTEVGACMDAGFCVCKTYKPNEMAGFVTLSFFSSAAFTGRKDCFIEGLA
jgi:hypothetical protein